MESRNRRGSRSREVETVNGVGVVAVEEGAT